MKIENYNVAVQDSIRILDKLNDNKVDDHKKSNIPKAYTDRNNVVAVEELRDIQKKVLNNLSNYLEHTFGPMGSYTKIIKGNTSDSMVVSYSKDGHTVLKHIFYSNPIEMSIVTELEDVTRHVELEVGDGTTSAVMLSNLIFKRLLQVMNNFKDTIPPYKIIELFKEVINSIQLNIKSNKREVSTREDIYNICMISTNSNEEISQNIADIYEQFGNDVEISVSISNTKENKIKIYDGLTLGVGYSDPCYINNKEKGVCEIDKPEIYAFKDPVDTHDMINIFGLILNNNIVDPIISGDDIIPTVIIAPRLSRDLDAMLGPVIDTLNTLQYKDKKLLILTDINGSNEASYLDIAKLCGCRYIKKYIDAEVKKADMEKGLVPNSTNFRSFSGLAEQVVSDVNKTKFINPCRMFDTDENGNRIESNEYKALVEFLRAELDHAKENGEDDRSVYNKKKRLHSLKCNLVEFLVGGITIADRDSLKDLVVDAVKNCRSACDKGFGYAANFEGLRASLDSFLYCKSLQYLNNTLKYDENSDEVLYKECRTAITAGIFNSYYEITRKLYATVEPNNDTVEKMIEKSILYNHPYNLKNGNNLDNGKTVLTSIDTDIKILEAISKLISLMVTSNQCLLQSPNLNIY